jgi:phosphoglycolate phosphatase-like HAD superfamily hydrolase
MSREGRTGRDGRTVFLDLDGPVLDVAERYHRLHADLVSRHGGQPVDAKTYWQARRDRVPEAEILEWTGLTADAAEAALAARQRRLESPRYLRLDRPWPWAAAALADLADLAPLVLVTLRRHRGRLDRQLAALDLGRYFAQVVAGPGDGTREAKAELLCGAGVPFPAGSAFVGDTEVDVASGRSLGLLTIALRCGIRGDAALAACAPDLLLDDLRQVPPLLAARGWTPLLAADRGARSPPWHR